MARLPRLALAGALHHVILRGLVGESVFRDDGDRGVFLDMLREAAATAGVAVHAYALLDAEVHLLVTPRAAAGLGLAVQGLGRRYVAAFNRRHGRRGTLWDGRYRASAIEAQALLHDATVFVETRPVAAGLVPHAADWPWSSAAHHLGRRRDPLLADHPAHWQLGNTPFERELAHARRLEAGLPRAAVERFEAAAQRGHALGSAAFVAAAGEAAGRRAHPGKRGRPRAAGQDGV